jgi:lipopolysaccharide export system protein LptA
MRMTLSRTWLTIERLRNLVLIGGLLLVAAIVIFLAAGQWTRRRLIKDLPNKLGINIEQQADGVNYTQTSKHKTIFKIHAARAVTMKIGGKTLLHDVKIDLYGEDGRTADTISGSEFEYDAKGGVATAAGAVEITMMRPGVKPAIAQLKPGSSKARPAAAKPEARNNAKGEANHGLSQAAGEVADDQIHVKTSGLTFDQKSGMATTSQRVDFALRQGRGNSMGATYNSQMGQLILDHAVELHVERPGGPVDVHAGHAEFERGEMVCRMTQAKAEFTGSTAQTANALMHFRADGSVEKLDGSGGVDLETKSGGHVTAPVGMLEFDENNRPQHGLLQGGARLTMAQPNRQIDAASPLARLGFDGLGRLSQAHMEQGVVFNSQQQAVTVKGAAQIRRSWKSQSADVAFAPAAKAGEKASQAAGQSHSQGHGQVESRVEPRTIHGYGGVVVTSESTSNGVGAPSKLSADTVVAELAPGGALSSLVGTGHASFDERTAAGVHQASSADQLDVRFVLGSEAGAKPALGTKNKEIGAGSEIASIVEIGHVVLTQDAPAGKEKKGAPVAGSSDSPDSSGLRATAGRADYDGGSQVLHLTVSPRVQDGGLDISADRIDFARATGDAFAHGDVRASWIGNGANATSEGGNSALKDAPLLGAGGNGPVHAIAAEAELHQATEEAVFRGAGKSPDNGHPGAEPRLWQSVNSVSAPIIILNRRKMTLTAEGNGAANPVRTVLIGNAPVAGKSGAAASGADGTNVSVALAGNSDSGKAASKRGTDELSVIRVRSGDLHYSGAERLAVFHGGSVGSVTAETTGRGGAATIVSQEAEVKLLPHGARTGAAGTSGAANSSIDRLTARDRVTADWPGRRGTGEKLVYLSEDGTFTLTGTSAAPPRITDQARGTVTGSALIYHSREDSVTVEGDGGKTETETRSKK